MPIKCAKHGLQKSILTCPHIRKDIGSGQTARTAHQIFLDTENTKQFMTIAIVCESCRSMTTLDPGNIVVFSALLSHWQGEACHLPELEKACIKCFKEAQNGTKKAILIKEHL